jgi:hypothetical protein
MRSAMMESHSDLFLDAQEMIKLTGRHRKSSQIATLKQMLIPFRVNAIGEPIVTRASIIGTPAKSEAANTGWAPRLAK